MEPVAVSMNRVAAALADQSNVAARGSAEIDVGIGHTYPEFFQTFHAGGNEVDGRCAATDGVVGNVYAIQCDRVLVAARPCYGSAVISKTTVGWSVIRSRSRLEC